MCVFLNVLPYIRWHGGVDLLFRLTYRENLDVFTEKLSQRRNLTAPSSQGEDFKVDMPCQRGSRKGPGHNQKSL